MALINKDNNARDEYYAKVRMMKLQKDEINRLQTEMSSMKEDLTEIKQILKELIGKGSNG